jgi:Cu(I)/Ag(I) efflux system membrane fusion protein
MSTAAKSASKRKVITSVAVAVLALIAVTLLRGPLVAWFTGNELAGAEGSAVAAHAGPYEIKAALAPDPPRQKDQGLMLEVRDSSGSPVDDATVDVVYDMPAMGAMAEMKGAARVAHQGNGRYAARFDLPMGSTWSLRATISARQGSASQGYSMTVGTPGLALGRGSAGAVSGSSTPGSGAHALAPAEYPPIAFDALRSGSDAYDRLRAKLARDDLQGIAADARALSQSLQAAHDAVPPARGDLVHAATQAREAAERLAVSGSLGDARKAFAHLNESWLRLVAVDARLTAEWHVFVCPMFEGQPRWMQRRDTPDNPYMGNAMPTCGSATTWQPAGSMGTTSTPSPGEIDHYTCSMHPSVKQPGPGTCPICGMNLEPVTKEQQDQGVVTIDEAKRQLIGVRIEPVVRAQMHDTFRAVGRVTYDESTLADVSLKVRGWITKLYVNETGQHVTRGQTLFTMYSPELYNAEQDFLLATQAGAEGPNRTELLGRASRQRLHLLGLTDSQIDTIAKNGKPSEDLAIPSPASGFVTEKNVVEGASVDAGMRLYRIAALSKVWIEAEVYEADLAHVHVGQPASVTLDYLAGRAYQAKVAYVYPYLDPTTRTGRVRLEIANKQLELLPGMYATVELSSDLGTRVQMPAAAVVYTGPRRLVFVDLGGGRFRPQEVHVGTESNGMYDVLSGVAPGDLVATSGVFLIAAEARITTAAKYWDSQSEASDAGAPPPSAPPALQLRRTP